MGTGAAGPQGYSAQLSSFGAPAAPGYSTRASGVADPYNYPSPYDPTGTYAPTGIPLDAQGQQQFVNWIGSNPWASLANLPQYSGLRTEDIFSATSGRGGTLGTGTFQNQNPNYYIRGGPTQPYQIPNLPATNYAFTDWGNQQFEDYLRTSASRGGAFTRTPGYYSNPQYRNLTRAINRDYGRVPLDQILSFSRAWTQNPNESGQYNFPGSYGGANYAGQTTPYLPSAAYNPVGLEQGIGEQYEQHRDDWLYNMYFLDPTVNAQMPGPTVEWPEWDPGLFSSGDPYDQLEALAGDYNGDGIPDNMPLSQFDFFNPMGEGLPTWAETYWDYGSVPNPYYSDSLFPLRAGQRSPRSTLTQYGRQFLENLTPSQLYLSSFYPNMSVSDLGGRQLSNLVPGQGVSADLGSLYRNATMSEFFGAPGATTLRRRRQGRGGGGAPAGYAWRTRDPEVPEPTTWGIPGQPFFFDEENLGLWQIPEDIAIPDWMYGTVSGDPRPAWSETDYSGVFTDPYITPTPGWNWWPSEEQIFIADPTGDVEVDGEIGRYITPLENPRWDEGVPVGGLTASGWPAWDEDALALTPSGMISGDADPLYASDWYGLDRPDSYYIDLHNRDLRRGEYRDPEDYFRASAAMAEWSRLGAPVVSNPDPYGLYPETTRDLFVDPITGEMVNVGYGGAGVAGTPIGDISSWVGSGINYGTEAIEGHPGMPVGGYYDPDTEQVFPVEMEGGVPHQQLNLGTTYANPDLMPSLTAGTNFGSYGMPMGGILGDYGLDYIEAYNEELGLNPNVHWIEREEGMEEPITGWQTRGNQEGYFRAPDVGSMYDWVNQEGDFVGAESGFTGWDFEAPLSTSAWASAGGLQWLPEEGTDWSHGDYDYFGRTNPVDYSSGSWVSPGDPERPDNWNIDPTYAEPGWESFYESVESAYPEYGVIPVGGASEGLGANFPRDAYIAGSAYRVMESYNQIWPEEGEGIFPSGYNVNGLNLSFQSGLSQSIFGGPGPFSDDPETLSVWNWEPGSDLWTDEPHPATGMPISQIVATANGSDPDAAGEAQGWLNDLNLIIYGPSTTVPSTPLEVALEISSLENRYNLVTAMAEESGFHDESGIPYGSLMGRNIEAPGLSGAGADPLGRASAYQQSEYPGLPGQTVYTGGGGQSAAGQSIGDLMSYSPHSQVDLGYSDMENILGEHYRPPLAGEQVPFEVADYMGALTGGTQNPYSTLFGEFPGSEQALYISEAPEDLQQQAAELTRVRDLYALAGRDYPPDPWEATPPWPSPPPLSWPLGPTPMTQPTGLENFRPADLSPNVRDWGFLEPSRPAYLTPGSIELGGLDPTLPEIMSLYEMSIRPRPTPTGQGMGMVPVFLVGNAEGGVIKSSSGNKYESNAPSLDLIDMTVSALMGEVEKSDKVVKEFIAKYGEDALAQLAEDVISGGDGSFLRGPGDGKADDVPGLIDGSEPVMLSSGEYVVPADAVKGLGDGSESRGADRLMRMIDDIRNMKSTTGVPGQLA